MEEVVGGELAVLTVGRPTDAKANPVTVLEPEGDLFDGGLFEVVGERGLAGAWCGAGEDVAAGVGDTRGGGKG